MSHSNDNKPEVTEQQDGNNLIDQFLVLKEPQFLLILKAVLLRL